MTAHKHPGSFSETQEPACRPEISSRPAHPSQVPRKRSASGRSHTGFN